MVFTRGAVALLAVLAVASACPANVAAVVYRDDSGYQRARVAAHVAQGATLIAVGLAVVWVLQDRSRAGRAAAMAFGAVVFLSCGLVTVSPPTRFPDEPSERPSTLDSLVRPRGSPREPIPEELAMTGILAAAAVSFGGLAALRFAARRVEIPADLPGGSDPARRD